VLVLVVVTEHVHRRERLGPVPFQDGLVALHLQVDHRPVGVEPVREVRLPVAHLVVVEDRCHRHLRDGHHRHVVHHHLLDLVCLVDASVGVGLSEIAADEVVELCVLVARVVALSGVGVPRAEQVVQLRHRLRDEKRVPRREAVVVLFGHPAVQRPPLQYVDFDVQAELLVELARDQVDRVVSRRIVALCVVRVGVRRQIAFDAPTVVLAFAATATVAILAAFTTTITTGTARQCGHTDRAAGRGRFQKRSPVHL